MLLIENVLYSYDPLVELSFQDISLEKNSQLLISGGSGKGKTTFLHLVGGLLTLQKGLLKLNGVNYGELKGSKLDRFRANNIGIVFQKPHLISSLTVLENLLLSQTLANQKIDKELATRLLGQVGLAHKSKAKTLELSAGQAQRVSLLRAVINKPALILADEPTSSLDDENANDVINLLLAHAKENKSILLITTHDQRVKERIKNQYLL